MIPSTWFRRVLLAFFILEVAGLLMWLSARIVSEPEDRAFAQTVAGIVFLLGVYAGSPLTAKFLAPHASTDVLSQSRLASVAASLPGSKPVFLYDHEDGNANAVGIIASHSRVYVTSGLMNRVSDIGLRGILAHEDTHVREHHILVTFSFACVYALAAHLSDSSSFFLLGFLSFMGLRRYLEFRADRGGAAVVGNSEMVQALEELHAMYPTKWWSRFFSFAAPYPTMPMRINAIRTGKRPLF